MRVSYRWLKKFLNFEISTRDLVEAMTRGGLEVDSVIDLGYGGEPIVVAGIEEIAPHPGADNLSICQVSAGAGGHRQVVSGAKNFGVGDRAPLALPGARLASGLEVAETTIRGQKSEGMLCSGAELGWSADASGLLLLDDRYEIGQPFDFLIDVSVSPNRPDCLSIFGIARDVAAMFNKKVYHAAARFTESLDHIESFVTVTVRAREQCPRYGGRYVKDVRIGPSPLWLQRALESGGLRPINNIVDATNYILLEHGQPMHAFDVDKVANNQIVVRLAEEGQTVELIDGVKVALTAEDLVIADPVKIIALAGVMGARNTEINESTVNVFLECAYFDPVTIRRSARRLDLSSDSSYRFERGVDRGRIPHALNHAALLIKEIAGGEVAKGSIDTAAPAQQAKPIPISLKRTNALLGLDLKGREVADILVSLGFEILHFDHDTMMVNVPTHRVDVKRDVDLIEEVARLYGYNKIPSTRPALRARLYEPAPETRVENSLRTLLTSLGFSETIAYTFCSKHEVERFGASLSQAVTLLNPLSQDQAHMRPSLAASMLGAMRYNLNRGNRELRLFEVGQAFAKSKDAAAPAEETLRLCVGICGMQSWHWRSAKREVDFFDIKAVAEQALVAIDAPECEYIPEPPAFLHPGRAARVEAAGLSVGWLGEVHPSVREEFDVRSRAYLLELNLTALLPLLRPESRFEHVPRFPAVERDLALVLDEAVLARDVEKVIRSQAGDLLESCRLFDFFRGGHIPKGKKSLAYRLVYRAKDRTLTDSEIETIQTRTIAALESSLSATLR